MKTIIISLSLLNRRSWRVMVPETHMFCWVFWYLLQSQPVTFHSFPSYFWIQRCLPVECRFSFDIHDWVHSISSLIHLLVGSPPLRSGRVALVDFTHEAFESVCINYRCFLLLHVDIQGLVHNLFSLTNFLILELFWQLKEYFQRR